MNGHVRLAIVKIQTNHSFGSHGRTRMRELWKGEEIQGCIFRMYFFLTGIVRICNMTKCITQVPWETLHMTSYLVLRSASRGRTITTFISQMQTTSHRKLPWLAKVTQPASGRAGFQSPLTDESPHFQPPSYKKRAKRESRLNICFKEWNIQNRRTAV